MVCGHCVESFKGRQLVFTLTICFVAQVESEYLSPSNDWFYHFQLGTFRTKAPTRSNHLLSQWDPGHWAPFQGLCDPLGASVKANMTGGTSLVHWCKSQVGWHFCNPTANVRANWVGGTSFVHWCKSQPHWHFCNPTANVRANWVGGTLLIHWCKSQCLWYMYIPM